MIYVLYHGGGCPDGFGAAWAAYRALGDANLSKEHGSRGVNYLPVMYHEPPPAMEPGSTVYLVDFCYSPEALRDLAARASKVVVIDHHKTHWDALQRHPLRPGGTAEFEPDGTRMILDGNITAAFDMGHSGAVLTWQHFHPGEPVPLLLQYVEDRDLWRWKLQHSREFSAYLESMPQNFQAWTDFYEQMEAVAGRRDSYWNGLSQTSWSSSSHPFLIDGRAILRAKDQIVQASVKRARWAVLAGHRVPVVNATVHGSETAEALCLAHPDAPFAAYYFDTKDGRRAWGLRSRDGFDVSAVAKQFGGGGHPAAAGFTTDREFYGLLHAIDRRAWEEA